MSSYEKIENKIEEAKSNLHHHLFAAKDQMDALDKLMSDFDDEEPVPNLLGEMYAARELTKQLEAIRDQFYGKVTSNE